MLAYKVEKDYLIKEGRPLTGMKAEWHPLNSFLSIVVKYTRDARLISSRAADGTKMRRQGTISALAAQPSGAVRRQSTRPKQQQQQQQQQQPRYSNTASMVAQPGGTRRTDYPRTARGTYKPRGGNASRGRGRPGDRTSIRPAPTARSAGRGGRGRNSNYTNATNGQRSAHVNAVDGSSRAPVVVSCRNCGRPYHTHDVCRKYNGEKPGNRRCRCGGYHARPCVEARPLHAMSAEHGFEAGSQ
jgi:hypothetical protein